MAVTVSNYRIIPYAQKDGLAKVIFGGTWNIEITLPTAHESGDGYILALDYERVVYPLARPVCAYSNEFSIDGDALTMAVSLDTLRLAKWVSSIRKPTPICVQIVRVRGEIYETLLLDEILALPSVANGDAYADPHSPIMDTLAEYVGDGATTIRQGGVVKGVITANQKTNNVIDLDAGGGGGGSVEQATDAEIDARESTTHAITPNNLDYAGRSVVPNITAIPALTSAYALLDATATTNNHSWQYAHAPTAASTYTLPAVTDTSVAHRIKLTIDFATVQTYAFEDAQGNALAPLFTPTIAAGDVYEFDCEYSVAKSTWLIWPHKQGAVSDDYVMQSEVGAANGVAGLDNSSKVPRANLPIAGTNLIGGVKIEQATFGLSMTVNGGIRVSIASNTQITARDTVYNPISPYNLNTAVKAALTDANKIQLTDAQKASAQDTLGVGPAPIVASGAPTTSTAGAVGQLLLDTATSKTYHCTAITVDDTNPQNPVTTYTWTDDVNAKGGAFTGAISLPGVHINNTAAQHLYWNMQNDLMIITGAKTQISNLNMSISCKENGVFQLISAGMTHLLTPIGLESPIITIPSATSAYTLSDGIYQHAPETASTYTLPPDMQYIIVDSEYYHRTPTSDGVGYYAWMFNTTKRYTASPTPATGDNSYSNTALTVGARPLTVDERTHECILTVRFSSSVLTYAFEDSAGNALTPLPLAGTIADGSVVCFRCTWEALLNQWVIMPVMLGTYTAPEP